MPSTTPAVGGERVLHCSPARTVIDRVDAATGQRLVTKVYVSGSLADAEREFAWGHVARGAGVVVHVAVRVDTNGRPCVNTQHEEGVDLDRLVAEQGALPAAFACEVLAPVAATLARLHALRAPAAPVGLCHGDVKPKNLLRTASTTLLLDFEHAAALSAPGGTAAAGSAFGTAGFAAPEAAQGVPAAAIDVWALGATLAWLLAGGDARVPQDARVEALLAACMHADPSRRPSAAELAVQLAHLAQALANDPAEAVLADWATGALALPVDRGDAADARSRSWRRRERLLRHRPHLLATPAGLPVEPAPMLAALRTTARVLLRFPRHAATLRWRRQLLDATGRLLADAPQHTTAQIRLEAFAAAATWLADLDQLARVAMAMPGGAPVPLDDGGSPGPLQRDPLAMLPRLRAQVAAADETLREDVEAIAGAERELDLRAAEAAVDAMAARHGGTSPTAARQRDRLHRLGFYLDRVARAEPNVERVTALWDAAALQPLTQFVGVAGDHRAREGRGESQSATVGLRSLQLTLANLAEEFPHLPQVPPALDALTQALVHLTDQAWQLLADARTRLQAVPVPVRPLQLTLGRLDTFRVLEAFLDRPERPRSQLLDQIEALRLSLEQARATRDRLAESAESALARGHWTTGLFDMERAVAGIEPVDDQEREEATRLRERLQQARRRKAEVEANVRRNVDLATAYGTLQDDPTSAFGARLQVLEDRRACLLFLTMHVPAERSVLYHRDLRDVDTQIALERAGVAEHELDGTVDPIERLRIARATLSQLSASVTQSDHSVDPPGRVVRLLEHWRTVAEHCQRAIDQLYAERALRARQRRRTWAVLAAAVIATFAAIAFAVRPWLQGEPASAAGKNEPGKK